MKTKALCSISIAITAITAPDGAKLEQILNATADRSGLLGLQLFRDGNALGGFATVYRGITDDEVKSLVGWLTGVASISEMTICYTNEGARTYGEYYCADGTIYHRYLAPADYPAHHDDVGLEAALCHHATVKVVR